MFLLSIDGEVHLSSTHLHGSNSPVIISLSIISHGIISHGTISPDIISLDIISLGIYLTYDLSFCHNCKLIHLSVSDSKAAEEVMTDTEAASIMLSLSQSQGRSQPNQSGVVPVAVLGMSDWRSR